MAATNFIDGSTVIQASWLNDVDETVYGVKSFGATGDGATDDTAAINAAIAAAASGGIVYFPPGNYRTTSTIVLGNINTILRGAGRNKTSILADFRGGAVIEINQARCAVTDMAISTLSTGARRAASPFGKTAPDATVDGNSLDRGIFLNEVGFLTFTYLARLEIVNQPGDGLNMSGVGTCSRFEQLNINNCGGHGMYFDDGDRDGTPKTRNGIVDIVNCLVQLCWGHGIALATAAASTVYRYNLINPEVFGNTLGDDGVNQPPFLNNTKAEIAARVENLRIELGAVGFSDYGIVFSSSNSVDITGTRFVSCTLYGAQVNPTCRNIKITNPYFIPSPANAGFRVQTDALGVNIEGVNPTQVTTIIDSESETRLLVNNKIAYTVPGSNSLWYNEEIVTSTISAGIANIQGKIINLIGEGNVTDSVGLFRFAAGVNIPTGYTFTVCNFNAYNLTLTDISGGGTNNIQLQGANAVLEPGESLSFVVNNNICYAIGREIP